MRALLLLTTLILATTLPVIADDWVPEGSLRVKRGSLASTTQHLDEAFSEAPRPKDNGNAEFTLDVSRFAQPQNVPIVPISPGGFSRAGQGVMRALLGRDLQVLSSRDVIVLIDKSGSMGDRDCPPSLDGLRFPMRNGEATQTISRWEWTENELLGLARNAGRALPNGMRIVLFDGDQTVYDRVNISQISHIFQSNYPEGNTNVAAALHNELNRYFATKAGTGGRAKPIVIAIITDGLPSSVSKLKTEILEATRNVRSPAEIAITFLQIGKAKKGVKLVHDLDDSLTSEGALCDVVDSKDFDVLQQIGLGHALVDAVNEAGQQR